MEEKNVVFEVTKVGIAVNSKWSVFVDNEYVGKIDFKNNLTKKLPKGRHSVQYKVGLQKTQVLNINIADEDIIVECVWDGTVRNFHVVGGNDSATNNVSKTNFAMTNNEDYMYCSKCGTKISKESTFCNKCGNKIEQLNTQTMNGTVQSQNTIIDNQIKSNNENINEKPKTSKKTNAIIIITIIIVGLIIAVGFAMFNDNSSNDVSVKIKQSYVTSDKEMRILFFDNGSCIMYESGATQDEMYPALYTIDKENKEIILKFDNGSIFGFEYISSTSIRLAYHIENGRKITDSILFTLDEKFMK